MVVSQAKRPLFSPDIRKLFQQPDGLFQVPLFLAMKLPFIGMVTAMMRHLILPW
jgi:hypothetical protein